MRKKKEWSPNGYIFAALRRIFRWSPERKKALSEAFYEDKDKFRCARCSDLFPKKAIAVDHIIPVVDPGRGFSGWGDYIDRLFCRAEGLQVLCKVCHHKKTQEENKIRRERKKAA